MAHGSRLMAHASCLKARGSRLMAHGKNGDRKDLNKSFQHGNGIILLRGALVRSNFDGFKSPKNRFRVFLDYWECHRPLGTLIFWLCRNISKQKEADILGDNIAFGKTQDLKNWKMGKTRAWKSLRSVL